MESFIVKLGNAFATAFGISTEAIGVVLLLGVIWFYVFKWKPFYVNIMEHTEKEDKANRDYALRSAERDKLAKGIKESIVGLDSVIAELSTALDKAQSDRDQTMRDGSETKRIVVGIKEDLIRINTRLEMSPNARELS